MTSINYLERCMMKLYKENAEKLVKRRQEDVKQQSMEYMPGWYLKQICTPTIYEIEVSIVIK